MANVFSQKLTVWGEEEESEEDEERGQQNVQWSETREHPDRERLNVTLQHGRKGRKTNARGEKSKKRMKGKRERRSLGVIKDQLEAPGS